MDFLSPCYDDVSLLDHLQKGSLIILLDSNATFSKNKLFLFMVRHKNVFFLQQ